MIFTDIHWDSMIFTDIHWDSMIFTDIHWFRFSNIRGIWYYTTLRYPVHRLTCWRDNAKIIYTVCVFFFSQDTQNSAIIKCTRIVPIAICIGCTREGLKRFAHRMSQRLLIKTTKILLQIGTCNNICTFTESHAYEEVTRQVLRLFTII